MLEDKIKKMCKETKMTWKRVFMKVILGEFNRINDGKPVTDDQCIAVIKKLIKNSKEILKLKENDAMAEREIDFLQQFLPKQATIEDMEGVISLVMCQNEGYKNVMQLMKPCIDELEKIGYDVDKNKLSKLLLNKKGGN